MEQFEYYRDKIHEIGIITYSQYPLVIAKGLPGARIGELIRCSTGQLGQIFLLDRDQVEILLLDPTPVRVGTEVVRTDEFVSVPVGDFLLNRSIDALGRPVDRKVGFPEEVIHADLFPPNTKPLYERKRISERLHTGISVVDILVPIAKGQRQLVVGDRKTGKTSFLQSIVMSQALDNTVIVYAGIGKKQSEISRLSKFFFGDPSRGQFVVFVASHSMESASLIYLTPYTAMAVAEYFSDQGKDVLVVFDDLSTHAKFYREISLIARRFPGREAYPGDIFYVHSRLLERAGAFSSNRNSKGVVTITCLPVAELVEGDITGFISTNLMGMTDGHMYFDNNVFNEGRRPPINIPLSVTRVGKQTQPPLLQEIQRRLTAFLSDYEKTATLSHFGAELSSDVRDTLKKGTQFMKFFDQHFTFLIPLSVQMAMIGLLWSGSLISLTDEELNKLRTKMLLNYNSQDVLRNLLEEISQTGTFDEFILKITQSKERIFAICQFNNVS